MHMAVIWQLLLFQNVKRLTELDTSTNRKVIMKVWSDFMDTTVKLSGTVRPLENDLFYTGCSSGLRISPPCSKEASLSPACPQLSPSQTTCKGKRDCKRSCQSIDWWISSFGQHQKEIKCTSM